MMNQDPTDFRLESEVIPREKVQRQRKEKEGHVAVKPITVLSLGAGVQSSTLALMAAKGEFTPMPHAAIFADTKVEPPSVYEWLAWLEQRLPFPLLRVSKGHLGARTLEVRWSKKKKKNSYSGIPAFLRNADGSLAMAPRQCTRDFKVDPITTAVNEIRRHVAADRGIPFSEQWAVLWIGISVDECHRAKEHRLSPRITNQFPLLDRRMNRQDCLRWMGQQAFPEPPRSACVFCPYHSDAEWRRLKEKEPESFLAAFEFEKQYQKAMAGHFDAVPFLHRSLVPLNEVDFDTEEDRGQLNVNFGNECEGMCGV